MSDSSDSGRLARYIWWAFLVTGVSALVVGAVTLATTPDSVATLAKIAGVALVFDALLLALLASQAQEWNGFYLLGGLTAIAGVALLFSSPGGGGSTRVAIILGGILTLRGLVDGLVAWGGITDFTEASSALWEWVLLVVGTIIFLLGLVALVAREGSTSTLLVIVGSAILARGIGLIAVSYRLRSLT